MSAVAEVEISGSAEVECGWLWEEQVGLFCHLVLQAYFWWICL
jgi:hypothetical protein